MKLRSNQIILGVLPKFMKIFGKDFTKLSLVIVGLGLCLGSFAQPVAIHGALSVSGNKIVNKKGLPVSFAGNSLFWSNDGWGGEKYYNANVVSWLRTDWNAGVVRAAMGVEDPGGYLQNKTSNKAKVKRVVDAAIANNMYVLIDWHSHNAELYPNEAIEFFTEMAQTYGNNPHVIYEIYNEPIHVSWSNTIKPYAIRVIDAIRQIDPDNLIIVGTPKWSADVDEAANDPINRSNIAYTVHFYAGTHHQPNRDKCQYALNRGIALFATEWGAVNANGDGAVNQNETNAWMDFLKRNHISHCNWAINDKAEGSSALTPGSSSQGNWSNSNLTWSGSLVKGIIKAYDYGTLTEELNFLNSPNLITAKNSYVVEVGYAVLQKRDLVISFSDSLNNVIASTTTQIEGAKSVNVTVNLNVLPIVGRKYSWKAEIRPLGGSASANISMLSNQTVIVLERSPIVEVEAEAYNAMSGIQQESCIEGESNVGFLDNGDWLSYNPVTIPKAGKYLVFFRVASTNAAGIISLEKDAGLTKLGTFNVPNSGGWQKWTTISRLIDLPQGTYSLGLGISSGGFNLNWFAIAPEPCSDKATISSNSTSFCEGSSLDLTATTGISYNWLNGTNPVGTSQVLKAQGAGNYTVEVTFQNGCKGKSSIVTISVNSLPTASISADANSFCEGSSLLLTASDAPILKWFNNGKEVGNTKTILAQVAGSYTVEVTNASGCKNLSAPVLISEEKARIWYKDADGDGQGDLNDSKSSCTQPIGFISVAGDLCPNDVNKVAPGDCGCGNQEGSCLDCAGVPNGSAVVDACNVCAGGTTGKIPTTDSQLCGITSVDDTQNYSSLLVSPNPFDDFFTLSIPKQSTKVSIYDVHGKMVEELTLIDSVNLGTNLKSGIYLIRCQLNGKWVQSKIVKK